MQIYVSHTRETELREYANKQQRSISSVVDNALENYFSAKNPTRDVLDVIVNKVNGPGTPVKATPSVPREEHGAELTEEDKPLMDEKGNMGFM